MTEGVTLSGAVIGWRGLRMDCHSGEASNDSLRSAEGARNDSIPKLSGKRTEISGKYVGKVYQKDQSDGLWSFFVCQAAAGFYFMKGVYEIWKH